MIEQDDASALPLGVAAVARNVKYHLTAVRTRDGLQAQFGFVSPNAQPITGLASLKLDGAQTSYIPIVYDQSGAMYIESPVGSGKLKAVTSTQVTLPAFSMQVAAAYKKGYLAFTDLLNSQGAPAVYNLSTGNLDPFSSKQVGQTWAANTAYQVGEVLTPTAVGGNGHTYRITAITTGISGANEPVWPLTEGGVIVNGGITLTETTPTMAQTLQIAIAGTPTVTRNAGAGAFAGSRDVYIAITITNGNGESVLSAIFSFLNTTANDQFVVTAPVLPAWVSALTGANAATGYSVYEADVAHGSAAPATTSFKLVSTSALNANVNVNNSGAGAAPPTVDNSRIVPVGNICAGLRYAIVLFVNRNGYISGMSQASVVSYNPAVSPGDGLQLYMAHVPLGPSPSTAARIVAFTPAGLLSGAAGTGITSAGPFFWIPPNFPDGIFDLTQIAAGVTNADSVNGVVMTSTLINDNTSTTATFNFTDDYLKSTLNDVSSYFDKIQITAADDIFYLKTVKRLAVADPSFPSGWRLSLPDDPESFMGSTGFFNASENDGQRRTAIREFGNVIYPMKEDSGFTLTPNADDPTRWDCQPKWQGSGPCGPRAVDVTNSFMCYVHRSGVYIFFGTHPQRISKEIPITWSQINWAAQQTIWVHIDHDSREIRIGVPYGQNVTTPNLILKCNYEESPNFEPPIHFSPYIGKEIASGSCYKWSIDDIAANLCIRAKRPLVNQPLDYSGQYTDLAFLQTQLLFASSNADGVVTASMPGVFHDQGYDSNAQQYNNVGIDSVYETAAPGQMMRPSKCGGIQANLWGEGDTYFTIIAGVNKAQQQGGVTPDAPITEVKLKKTFNPMTQKGKPGFSCGARISNERFRLRISNNKQPDSWFDLRWAAIMGQPISTAAPK